MMDTNSLQQTVLAGGCFWCLEAVFDQVRGVIDVVSGYAGGRRPQPTYEQVCSGLTGHPQVISFEDLLHIFFTIHDPTTLNRQGADVGTQYRSAIFYTSKAQKTAAENVMRELSAESLWSDPIVTQLQALQTFYPAEEYHQQYFARNPNQGYCRMVVAPKVTKFRQKYAHLLIG